MSLNKILSSTKYVMDNAKYVSIDYDRVDEFCNSFEKVKVEPFTSLLPINLSCFNDDEKIRFMFIQTATNFSFWGNPKWEYYYDNKAYSGSIGMFIALFVYVSNNRNLFNGKELSKLTMDDMKNIFPKDKNNQYIPLMEERFLNLIDVGKGFELISEKYNCGLDKIVDSFKDEEDMFKFVSKYFKSYTKDKAIYKRRTIYFHKRIQLLISDMNSIVYSGNKFTLNKFRIFPDYRIPQLMRDLKLINYNKELSDIVDNEIEIKKGSKMEVEIRSSIVQVGHYMVNKLKEKGIIVNDAYMDNYMFHYMKNNKLPNPRPHHRVRSINY